MSHVSVMALAQISAQIKRLPFVNYDPSTILLLVWCGISLWQREQQHDLSEIKLIMSRWSKTSYNIPLFSHGPDYCLMKLLSSGVYESCLQLGWPFHPQPPQTMVNHPLRQNMVLGSYSILNTASVQTLSQPPQVPIPIPHPIFKSALQ